jgi:hypothetical protein
MPTIKRANGDSRASLKRLLQDWSRRHTIEEGFQRCKSDLGMDHYEVRSWVGWHHHMTLIMLASWFLEKMRIKASRSFSPSDRFPHSLDPAGNDSATAVISGKTVEGGNKSLETLVASEVLQKKEPNSVKIIQKCHPKTLVN